jgi:hypothetical protein
VSRTAGLAAAVALLAAGCGGGTRDDASWPGDRSPRGSAAEALVAAFNDYAASVDAPWERSPARLAGEFLALQATPLTTIEAEIAGEGQGGATVIVTLDRLLDDSIRAERYVLGLRPDGEHWVLESVSWSQRCHPGRGHQAFSSAACV